MRTRLALSPALLVILGACGGTDASEFVTAPNLAAVSNGNISNAQSVMVSLAPMGPFVIQGTEIYAYDRAVAEPYFTNTVASGPVVTCSGSTANCALTNRPATPATPAADEQRLVPVVSNNSCTFFNGGALAVNASNASYTKSVTIPGANTKGNWTFAWTYAVATSATVDPKTAWNLQESNLTYPQGNISGFVAGQSTQKRANGAWTLKASHTLADLLSANGTRVSGLTATLTAPDASTSIIPLSVSLGSGDFEYVANGGTFGSASQLFTGRVSEIHAGVVSSVDGVDNFAGNNGAIAETAVIAPVTFSFGTAGSYGLTISGTVKGNEASVGQSFAVTQNVSVQAGGCTAP